MLATFEVDLEFMEPVQEGHHAVWLVPKNPELVRQVGLNAIYKHEFDSEVGRDRFLAQVSAEQFSVYHSAEGAQAHVQTVSITKE